MPNATLKPVVVHTNGNGNGDSHAFDKKWYTHAPGLVSQRIKALREERGWDWGRVSRESKKFTPGKWPLSKSTIMKFERKFEPPVDHPAVAVLAQVFDIPFEQFTLGGRRAHFDPTQIHLLLPRGPRQFMGKPKPTKKATKPTKQLSADLNAVAQRVRNKRVEVETNKVTRNERIRQAIAKGAELQDLARQYHLSATRIAQIRDGKVGGGRAKGSKPTTPAPLPTLDIRQILMTVVRSVNEDKMKGEQIITLPMDHGCEILALALQQQHIPVEVLLRGDFVSQF